MLSNRQVRTRGLSTLGMSTYREISILNNADVSKQGFSLPSSCRFLSFAADNSSAWINFSCELQLNIIVPFYSLSASFPALMIHLVWVIFLLSLARTVSVWQSSVRSKTCQLLPASSSCTKQSFLLVSSTGTSLSCLEYVVWAVMR